MYTIVVRSVFFFVETEGFKQSYKGYSAVVMNFVAHGGYIGMQS